MNFQIFKLVLEKAEEPEINSANICWIMEKAREFQKNIYFSFCSEVKVSACNAGDPWVGLGRYTREGNDNPLQYSCPENPMDGGACCATVHRVAKSQTRLSNFTFTFCFLDYAKAFDCVNHNKLWKILKEMGIQDLPLEKSVCRSGSNS